MSAPQELSARFGRTPVIGPAYHPMFKGAATLLVMAIVFYAYRALEASAGAFELQTKVLFAAAGLTVLFTYYGFLRSQVRIDADGIAQSWMFKRPSAWDDVRSARLMRTPAQTRLLVRLASGRYHVYSAGDAVVAQAFLEIARRYPG